MSVTLYVDHVSLRRFEFVDMKLRNSPGQVAARVALPLSPAGGTRLSTWKWGSRGYKVEQGDDSENSAAVERQYGAKLIW